MSQLPWVTYFAALSSPSLGSYQLPIASQLEVGLHADLSPPPGCFVWLELAQVMFMLSQVLWVHICNCPVVSRKYHFIPLAISTLFFRDDPQALVNMLISVLIFFCLVLFFAVAIKYACICKSLSCIQNCILLRGVGQKAPFLVKR